MADPLVDRVASFNLFWEKLWPQMLPPLAVCGLFLAVALFDFLPMLPLWLHISALVVFAVILGYSIWGLVRGDYHVGRLDARRRVEMDSGVAHRPLEALNDMNLSCIRRMPTKCGFCTRRAWRRCCLS